MSQTIVAHRYAEALFDEAVEVDAVADVDQDVLMMRLALADSTELAQFFKSPVISRDRKLRVTEVMFEGRVSETMLRFLRLLVSKRREQIVGLVLDSYRQLRDDHLGIVEARALLAREATEADLDRLAAALKDALGKEVRLEVDLDSDLLGGVLVRVGDTVIDGSARNRLEKLRERFRAGTGSVLDQ